MRDEGGEDAGGADEEGDSLRVAGLAGLRDGRAAGWCCVLWCGLAAGAACCGVVWRAAVLCGRWRLQCFAGLII